MGVVDHLVAVMRRRAMPTHFKHLEMALLQASQRIAVVAHGDLPATRWYHRASAAVAKLERAKLAVVDSVVAGQLDLSEAQLLVDGIDDTIAQLADEVARAPLPDDIRARLPDFPAAIRSVH